jgi:spermidine synthase
MQSRLLQIANPLFQYVSMFNFSNMTYPGGLWSFLWASKTKHPVKDMRLNSSMEMFYYNAGVHLAAFQLPEFQARALKPWTKI